MERNSQDVQKCLNAKYSRDYYARNRDKVLAHKKKVREFKLQEVIDKGGVCRIPGRPRKHQDPLVVA